MFTSLWAYVLGMPSSINILMVYAFCNWHDVSWGTKGSDKAETLPSVQTKSNEQQTFFEELEKPQEDIDTQFEQTVKRALTPYRPPNENEEASLDDSYKAFRTNLVLLWAFSNGLLAFCINNSGLDQLCFTVCCACGRVY
jgi:chitin synthase